MVGIGVNAGKIVRSESEKGPEIAIGLCLPVMRTPSVSHLCRWLVDDSGR